MALTANRKRARSAAEKESRREAILTAARYMIFEGGFDGIIVAGITVSRRRRVPADHSYRRCLHERRWVVDVGTGSVAV